MNYFYDFLANLKKDKLYRFYEWDQNDKLTHLKKVPFFRISSELLNDILTHEVFFPLDFLKLIENKAIMYTDTDTKKVKYLALFSDSKTSILVKLNQKGGIMSSSYLLLRDDLEALEMASGMKGHNVVYLKKEKNTYLEFMFRQEEVILDYFKKNITKFSSQKLEYLYYELTNKKEKDKDKIISYFKNLKEINEKHFYLYQLFQLNLKK